MKRIKKIYLVSIALAFIIACFSIRATYSYLSYLTPEIDNNFTFEPFDPHVYIEINEEEIDPGNVSWGVFSKPISVKNLDNLGAVPVVVRVMLVPSFKIEGFDTEGGLGEISEPVNNMLVFEAVTLHFNPNWSDSWLFCEKDGYFYYKEIVEPGEETAKLFSGVTQNITDLGDKQLDIEVLADAVEATKANILYTMWPVYLDSDGILRERQGA